MRTSRSRFARFTAPGLLFAAATCLALVARTLSAGPIAANAVYGFAEQKVYGMTINATPGSTAILVPDPSGFTVKMATQAAAESVPGVVGNVGGVDAPQSFIGSGTPTQPVENFSGNASPGMSAPPNERVLLQLNTTGAGTPGGFAASMPTAADFGAGSNFARSDGYVTPFPDTTVGPSGAGSVPAGLPEDGASVDPARLFAPIGTADTLSLDLVAEALLDGTSFARFASGLADWSVSGRFTVAGESGSRAAVALNFNLLERLVVYSWNPLFDAATVSNSLSLDVFDATGKSVFGPFLGANPSSTRMLSTQALGTLTYNNNTPIPTNQYPGPVNVTFQTLPLAPGAYTFAIKGTSTTYVTTAPEPATSVSLAAAAVFGCVVRRWRRRAAA